MTPLGFKVFGCAAGVPLTTRYERVLRAYPEHYANVLLGIAMQTKFSQPGNGDYEILILS